MTMSPSKNLATENRRALSRRSFIGAALAASLASPILGSSATAAQRAEASAQLAALRAATHAHPGLLHTAADIAHISSLVSASAHPWLSGWDRLVANARANASWTPRPLETVVRGGDGQNYAQLYPDVHAAYQNGLRWRLSASEAHGAAAVRILNAWSAKLKSITGNADRYLAAGIYGYQFANAAELVRDRPDFEFIRFRDMLVTIFAPMNQQFLTTHNNAVITNYWANWDLCTMASLLAIGIFADRDDFVDRAVTYFETGAGNGSISHAIPSLHPGGLGQWQESGRDQGHTLLGIGLMGAFCEMAWNQGIDCYGYDDNRFLKGAEYVAKYNLGQDVPFSAYSWQTGPNTTAPHVGWQTHTSVSAASRGQLRPVWELVLGHYTGRRGIPAAWVQQMAERVRAEGGGGDYGSQSGGYDQLGFGTLTHFSAQTGRRVVRFQSHNFPDRYVRTVNSLVRLEPEAAQVTDSQFVMVPGLASTADGRVSFESVSEPGRYLRHVGFQIGVARSDDSAGFAADATFRPVEGLAHPRLLSFRSHNYPDRLLRHSSFALRIDAITNDTGRLDSTFRLVD